jgi:hypothetical protein
LSTSQPEQSAALTNPLSSNINDRDDVNEPFTPTVQQRQQPQLPHQVNHNTSVSSGSIRTLRRTPRLESQEQAQPRKSHIEAVSVGIASPPRVRFAHQDRSNESQQPNNNSSLGPDPFTTSSLRARVERPHPAVRISKQTASAIRYALEALRHPNPFTPDLLEENASMSDLTGGGPSAAAGNGRSGNNGGSTRMYQTSVAPAPVGSPGRIRGPTVIMKERAEREARRKAEMEAQQEVERVRAEEQRLLEEDRLRRLEKKPAGAGAGAGAAGVAPDRRSGGDEYGSSGSAQQLEQSVSESSQRPGGATGNRGNVRPENAQFQARGLGGSALGGGQTVTTPTGRTRGPSVSQGQPRPVRTSQQPSTTQAQAGPSAAPPASQPPPQQTGESSTANATRRATSSFPQAFERWEALSAHWEGLTSYWIRRIEENGREIQRDPLSAQLSRQVTDLSAAGANLFHAVVDLQRLRVSSQKKFQRWLFEIRAEQERAQEMQAMLEATLQEERRGKAEAIADAVAREREKSNSEKLVAEMRRELQISREEARRAWEELGRREQEERERTASLRDGQPTIVGGVQVVPMMQGVPSRHTSTVTRERPPTREGPYAGGPGPGAMGGQSAAPPSTDDGSYQQKVQGQRGTDPFVESPRAAGSSSSQSRVTTAATQATTKSPGPIYSQAPAVQPTSSSGFYQQHHGTTLHSTGTPGSEGTYSNTEYEIDASGQIRRDSRGNKVRYDATASDDDTDDLDATAPRDAAHLQQYGHAPTSGVEYIPSSRATSAGQPEGMYTEEPTVVGPVDYSGQGYGAGPGWESITRHHHPTRLSDVQEEDERSASLVSRRE